MIRIRLLIWGVLLVFWVAGCSSNKTPIDVKLRIANKELLDGEYEASINNLKEVLQNWDSAEIHHNLGIAHYLNGENGMAVLHLEKSLKLDSTASKAKEALGLIRRKEAITSPEYSLLERLGRSLPEELWLALLLVGFWGFLVFGIYLYLFVQRRSVYRDFAIGSFLVLILATIACFGISEESKRGVLTGDENQLKVIPTPGGEVFMEFAAGEPAKLLKISGDYCFIQTEKSVRGWVLKEQFASIR